MTAISPISPTKSLSLSADAPSPFQVTFVLGGPGSGRGTQCNRLVGALGVAHLSAGDCLQAAVNGEHKDTELGAMIASYIKSGRTVPGDVTIRLLHEAMIAERTRSGQTRFLIDGFPRNVENLNGWIQKMGPIYPPSVNNLAIINMVLFLDCPESTMLERVTKLGNVESIGALKERIASFNTDTMFIVDQVRATAPSLIHTVDSSRSVDDVFESVHTLLTPLVTAAVEPNGLQGKQFGVDTLYANPHLLKDVGRIGIVTNQACFSSRMEPSTDVIFAAAQRTANARVTCVFGPQHGYHQTEQDNMIETPDTEYVYTPKHSTSGDTSDSKTPTTPATTASQTVPLFSLYSATRMPTDEQVSLIDTFVIDLQDIGCRVYTFQYTLAFCLRSAALHHKRVIVLDRPNPLGLCHSPAVSHVAPSSPSSFSRHDTKKASPPPTRWKRVSGNIMTDETKGASFVGLYDLPLQYGLTLGELGHFFCERDRTLVSKHVNYTVVPVPGLCRLLPVSIIQRDWYSEHVYAFLPSPNMPSPATSDAFIATVMLEATNISEGRGTTRPFNVIGAPYMDSHAFITWFDGMQRRLADTSYGNLNGIRLVPYRFRPTFNKHQGKICNGVFIHIDASAHPNLFAFGLLLLLHTIVTCANDFAWRDPKLGYEYNFTDPAINLILGSSKWKALFDTAQAAAVQILSPSTPTTPTTPSTTPASSTAPTTPLVTAASLSSLLESNVVTLLSMLQSAHEEACAFAISSRPFWLYF